MLRSMSKLESIAIEGFKSFGEQVEVPLKPLNVLIGANGAGKSNFLEAFSLLRAISKEPIDHYVDKAGGAERLLHLGSRTTQEMSISVSFDDTDGYFGRLFAGENDRLAFDKDDFVALGWSKYPDMGDQTRDTAGRFDSWRKYHFLATGVDSPMKRTANVDDNRSLRWNGSNLAAFLYLLRGKYRAEYRAICGAVKQVAPFFDDFVLEPRALNPETIRLEWQHRKSDAYFDASALSDGTLRFMALATLLLQPRARRPTLVLIDEPELGLHPYAIATFAAMVRATSRETQVVLATQSATLVDHFEPEDVLVADRSQRRDPDQAPRSRRIERMARGLQPRAIVGEKPFWGPSLGRDAGPGMTRLFVLVEGQTEETFVNHVLAPHLYCQGFAAVSARLFGNARQRSRRGGIRSWQSAKRDIVRHLDEDREAAVALMVDYYGLPQTGERAWPGRSARKGPVDCRSGALRGGSPKCWVAVSIRAVS